MYIFWNNRLYKPEKQFKYMLLKENKTTWTLETSDHDIISERKKEKGLTREELYGYAKKNNSLYADVKIFDGASWKFREVKSDIPFKDSRKPYQVATVLKIDGREYSARSNKGTGNPKSLKAESKRNAYGIAAYDLGIYEEWEKHGYKAFSDYKVEERQEYVRYEQKAAV